MHKHVQRETDQLDSAASHLLSVCVSFPFHLIRADELNSFEHIGLFLSIWLSPAWPIAPSNFTTVCLECRCKNLMSTMYHFKKMFFFIFSDFLNLDFHLCHDQGSRPTQTTTSFLDNLYSCRPFYRGDAPHGGYRKALTDVEPQTKCLVYSVELHPPHRNARSINIVWNSCVALTVSVSSVTTSPHERKPPPTYADRKLQWMPLTLL